MARDRGVYNMPGNIELSKEAPLDARRKVNTFAELFLEDTWKDSNNRVWLYDGMTVEVGDRLGELWQLKSKNSYSNPEDWIKISGGIEDAPKDGSPYMRKNGAWSAYTQIEEVYTFAPTISGNKITQEDYNGLKAAIEAGKIIAYGKQGMNGNYVAVLSASMEDTIRLMTFAGDSFQVFTVTPDLTFTGGNEYLILKNNTVEYEVTGDYNPAHKKYVDEAISNAFNVILLPDTVLDITQGMSSDDIFNKFSSKSAYLEVVKNANINTIIKFNAAICVVSYVQYTDDNTNRLTIQQFALNASQYIDISVSNGTASAIVGKYTFAQEGNVLLKNNTTAYTPTEPYHPATKKYVDDKIFDRDVDVTIINKWINNTVITGETVHNLVDELFGNFRIFVKGYFDGKYTDLRFSTRHSDDTTGAWFGYIINANIQYCLVEAGNEYYALMFTFGYMASLKCCYIYYYNVSTSNTNKIVITDVITSDNLTTITKKTAAEYEALGSKDANTAYCVTD